MIKLLKTIFQKINHTKTPLKENLKLHALKD